MDDLIGYGLDGGMMGDDDEGAPVGKGGQGADDLLLQGFVHAGGGLVEQGDRAVLQEGTGKA